MRRTLHSYVRTSSNAIIFYKEHLWVEYKHNSSHFNLKSTQSKRYIRIEGYSNYDIYAIVLYNKGAIL